MSESRALSPNSLKIVFIYLGKDIPQYVIKNAIRTAELFDLEVLLFVEDDNNIAKDAIGPSRLKIRNLTSTMSKHKQVLSHSLNFRKQFWHHTFNRLMMLKEIHRTLGKGTSILHVEADMLLMPSFPFEIVLKEKLKWFRYNQLSDVASLVYLPSLSETEWLHSQLLEEVNRDPSLTDMSALKTIRQKNPSRIEIFEDIFAVEERGLTPHVFDGLGLGMWLCGVDPRNTYGFTVLHDNGEYSPANTRTLRELMSEGEIVLDKNRLLYRWLDVIQEVHCIHVHSKHEQLFQVQNYEELMKYVELSNYVPPIVLEFRLRLMTGLFRENFRNRTLISYTRHLIRFLCKNNGIQGTRMLAIIKFVWRKRYVK